MNQGTRGTYTDEQEEGAKKIIAASKVSHYKCLNISKSADDSEVKKAYKKLALKYHPDKNNAPSAEGAFKAISTACQILSDPTKREQYDEYGHETSERVEQQGGGGGGGFGGFRGGGGFNFNGEEINPEDLFNMFFSGGLGPGMNGARVFHTSFGGPGMRQRRVYRQEPAQQRDAREEERRPPLTLYQTIFQFLPIIMLLLMTFGGFGNESSSAYDHNIYSLQPRGAFTIPRHTKSYNVVQNIPYYVNEKFSQSIGKNQYELPRVERKVEAEYREKLSQKCLSERESKNAKVYAARKTKVKETIDKAKSISLPACEELDKLFPQSNQNPFHM